ncbi:MAG TPA: META domain-containing protein [Allosphingosinicella sp.]|nr:META domain-containing protein [Allosphingosinicella sp.]
MRHFLIPIAVLAAGACATTQGNYNIRGPEWQAQDVNGVPLAGTRPLTLRLDGKNASGNSGCNSFSADVRISEERLQFGPIASTRMACEPAVMEQEQRYLAILGAARSYSRYGNGSISLIAPDGRAIRFRRVP